MYCVGSNSSSSISSIMQQLASVRMSQVIWLIFLLCHTATAVYITFQSLFCGDFLSSVTFLLSYLVRNLVGICKKVPHCFDIEIIQREKCQDMPKHRTTLWPWLLGQNCKISFFVQTLFSDTDTTIVCSSSIQAPDKRVACLLAHDKQYYTVFENYSKCRIWIFEFWHFSPFFVLLKMTYLVTLFDSKLQLFKNSPKCTIFGLFN